MNSENLRELYLIETKLVSPFCLQVGEKTRGGENEGEFGDVIENKCRKNVRKQASRDVDEKKWSY
jgi:hypothetical protein